MSDLRNSRLGLKLARSPLRAAGIKAYAWWSRSRASGDTPVVLLNSIPKSGTHLLANALDAVPALRFSGLHVFTKDVIGDDDRSVSIPDFERVTSRIRRGQYFDGHLPHTDALESHLHGRDIRVLFLYRHPFDLAISLANYVPKRPDHVYADLLMNQASSDSERLEFSLFGGTDRRSGMTLPSVAERMERHAGWLASPDVLSLRFEDLRSTSEVAGPVLARVAAHIGQDDTAVQQLMNGLALKKSATMDRGEVGRWRTEIPPELVGRATAEFGGVLERWGYPQSEERR